MSALLKAMDYLDQIADEAIDIEVRSKGLATKMFEAAKLIVTESGSTDKVQWIAGFERDFAQVEASKTARIVELTNDPGMTLTSYCSVWRVNKSKIKRGLKAGIDPNKFANFGKYIKAIDEKTGGNSAGSGNKTRAPAVPVDGNPAPKAGSTTPPKASNVTPIDKPDIFEGIGLDVQKNLLALLHNLKKLPVESQAQVVKGANGKVHQLLKQVGGRFGNVKPANKVANG